MAPDEQERPDELEDVVEDADEERRQYTDDELAQMQDGLRRFWAGWTPFIRANTPQRRRAAFEELRAASGAMAEILDAIDV